MEMDINCDLGEGMPDDALMMPFLGSCNIACGGHFGDGMTMQKALLLAKDNCVNVGAHPSYPDKENFGRTSLNLAFDFLQDALISQIHDFQNACRSQNMDMHHIKPHGALYNDLAKNENLATFFLKLMQKHFNDIPIFSPPNSKIAILAPIYGVKTILEVFADRSYNDDLTLVDRTHPKALLTCIEEVKEHLLPVIFEKKIRTISGKLISVEAQTVCVHGDNPSALAILSLIRSNFPS
jgi:UPF0271 protein